MLRPPKHLKQDGREFFKAVAQEYEIEDAAGLALLTTASECLDRMRAAQSAIAEHGEVIEDRYGGIKVHPACDLERTARAGFLQAVKALNLDLEPIRDRVGRPAGI